MDSRNWGLSKREHFAALILAGMLAKLDHSELNFHTTVAEAILMADILVERLAADREVA